jgi:PKD repeat protein
MKMSSSLPPPVSLVSSSRQMIAATIIIALILLASNFTIINAQQQQQQQQEQLSTQPSATENGTATTTFFQSTDDSFSVQVPDGWIIHDVNNTGFALGIEVLQGYGMLAQLCPEQERQTQEPLPNASGNTSSSSNNESCQGAQEEIIHIVRYPNLGARLGLASDDDGVITNEDITTDTILAYQMQKLQEVGYKDIKIVNSTDTTIKVISTALNNNVIATIPAKTVEMTYSTASAPDEIRRAYLISTATDATARNLGMITGYTIFYEGASAEGAQEQTVLSSGSLLLPSTPIMQVFNSFQLIAAPEVEQALLAALAAQAEEEEEPTDVLTVEMISNGTEGIAPATFEFEADITGGTEPYTIGWNLGDGPEGPADGETVLLTFNEPGTYNVAVTATDSVGQTASDSIEITVEEEPPMEEPPTLEELLAEETQETSCDSSYPGMCIPPPPPNLTCDDVGARNFEVVSPDPHGFDGDNDGIGCESESNQADLDGLVDNLIDGIL